MAEQRKDSRSAASLKVKYKSVSVDEFVSQFGTDVSRGGIFIKTKSPLEAGALLKLELQLSTSAAVIAGIGRVAWRRAASQDPAKPVGMGIKFIKLEPASQAIVDRIVTERGAAPSRFDQTEGAELARPSLEPPAPTSLAPERTSAPGNDAPATVRPPAPIAVPAAAVSSKQPLASKPLAPKPAPAPAAPAPSTAAVSRPRLAPAKATIPSGLFANSPLVQTAPAAAPAEEKRTSFFPPAPSAQPVARGGSNASGQLSAPRSSSGSISSPLHRPGAARAPGASINPRAAAPAGPKGVFGGPAPSSPLASSPSGMFRPAKEVSSVSSSSQLPDRSADEVPTAAVPRPPGGRNAQRAAQPVAPAAAAPSVLDALGEDLFDAAEGSGASSVDGMFATLEPLDPVPDAPPARASSPKLGERVTPAPSLKNGGMRDSSPRASSPRGLAAAEAADVDNLFADLEGNDDAPTDEVPKPAAASAVFSPGSTRPSLPPLADELASDEAFGEADLLGGDDKGAPPFADDDEDDGADFDEDAKPAVSEPPMLRLAEPAAAAREERKRSPALMIGLGAIILIVVIGAALALFKPDLLVQWGILAGKPPAPAAPLPPAVPVEVPAQPMTEPAVPAAAAPAAPEAAAEMIQVNVTSLPRGADVRVDGALKSQTPTNVDLPLGREANVTVSAQGYAAQAKLVTAKRDMDPLRFKLEPLPYVLVVTSTPAGAELSVGSVTSVSPAPLALGHVSGSVDVSVTKNGYRRTTRSVRLDEFVEKDGVLRAEIQVSLSPMPGTEAEAAPAEGPGPQAQPSSSSSSRRRRSSSRTPQAPLAPPEPEAAPEEPKPEAEVAPAPEPEPAKEPGAPPPPPSLPSLP